MQLIAPRAAGATRTKEASASRRVRLTLAVLAFGALYSAPSLTDVLPEDRADVEWSRYEGGGQLIEGKSWLIRKKIGDHVSVSYNHLIDVVSGASVDVKLYASPYIEQRTQDSVSVEYLHDKSTYNVSFTHSYEPDYRSNTAVFSVSQDMFGDLTTVSLSYRRTWNNVYEMECAMRSAVGDVCEDKIHDPSFGEKDMDERSYAVGLTQILTRNSILALNFEVITDQGWLSDPYRQLLYADSTSPKGFSEGPEIDPSTRTSNAIGGDYKYYLPYRAALDLQYRFFTDTWGIHANTAQLGYTQPWRNFVFDGSFRYYMQNHANFYSNLFPYANAQNFESRNRELSSYKSYSASVGASYQFTIPRVSWIQKSTVNVRYDYFIVDYEDFTLVTPTTSINPNLAPLYSLRASIYQFFVSLYF
jgi:hypothetical protein